jgi:hypothetical protein
MLQLTITVYRVNEAKKISKMRINVTMNLSVGRTILCLTLNICMFSSAYVKLDLE